MFHSFTKIKRDGKSCAPLLAPEAQFLSRFQKKVQKNVKSVLSDVQQFYWMKNLCSQSEHLCWSWRESGHGLSGCGEETGLTRWIYLFVSSIPLLQNYTFIVTIHILLCCDTNQENVYTSVYYSENSLKDTSINLCCFLVMWCLREVSL